MSKNVVIQEGGTGKQLTVNKLKTNLGGGGTCLWVPEDETQLGTKHISENGTYKASDDGYYGYSEVTVSGIGTVTGKDGDGDDAKASVDPDTGEIVITKLPYSISVVTHPNVTEYSDGATIDFSGMVVKGYLKSGDLWTDSSHPDGVIPISELTLPVTTADSGSVSGESATSPLIPESLPCGHSGTNSAGPEDSTADDVEHFSVSGGAVTLWKGSIRTINDVCASSDASAVVNYSLYRANGQTIHDTYGLNSNYTYNGLTVYFRGGSGAWSYGKIIKTVNPDATGIAEKYSKAAIAWTMIYGTITPGGQVIPVQYTGGEKTLESSFTITVNPTTPGYGTEE
ncbi:MAG: hypothetical protein IKE17_14535 [Clostridia bacterium]|nr:hypothetical protein [Clostridia bacterium]